MTYPRIHIANQVDLSRQLLASDVRDISQNGE
jgi:hypothetical protein